MSDYLWDKQGDADAEVARLETLLGAFKHEPRPLELPAEAATPEPRRSWLSPFASRLFAPAALAAAAALIIASVLVASIFLRPRVSNKDGRAAAPESSRPKEEARREERPAPRVVEQDKSEPSPAVGEVKDRHKVESVAIVNPPSVPRQRKTTQPPAVIRRQKKDPTVESMTDKAGEGGGLNLEAMSPRGGASALVENTRLLTKEQLVYALRFTGAKLRDVREKAQGSRQ